LKDNDWKRLSKDKRIRLAGLREYERREMVGRVEERCVEVKVGFDEMRLEGRGREVGPSKHEVNNRASKT
jgi:hypothetical protein